MQEHLAEFIINRVVSDYVRLRDRNSAPDIEHYAVFWPDDPRALIGPLLLEEFKYRRKQGDPLRTEAFLRQYAKYENDKDILLPILEFELRSALGDPILDDIRSRFPALEPEEAAKLIEQVMFYRVWHTDEWAKTVKSSPPEASGATENFNVVTETESEKSSAPITVTPAVDGGVTESFEPPGTVDVPAPSRSDLYFGKGKTPTVIWDNESIRSSMDFVEEHYQEVVGETVDVARSAPVTDSNAFVGKAKLRRRDEFTIRDPLQIEDYVGSGAWKDVYKARQIRTRQLVALKHLREKNDKECEALIREVRTQAQLTHQNIPPVFAFDLLENGEAIVTEKLVDGTRWSDTMGTRTLEDNLRILIEVGQAIAYAHRRHELIHRDLKPDNVVINDAFDEVYVIDWGLAVNVAAEPAEPTDSCLHISQVVGIAGTPLYWAPEMARGDTDKCCPASDVFLLGALLYEILTGYPPYGLFPDRNTNGNATTARFYEVGAMLRSVRGAVFPPKVRSPERFIPDELAAIAMKAMSSEPEDRYVDGGEFVDAIKRYQHHAEATIRCDAAWKTLHALADELHSAGMERRALHPLTLRLIELSDTFHQIFVALTGSETRDVVDQDDPLEPAVRSAVTGELESRRLLFETTLRTGDLALATAQIELMQRNPDADPAEIRERSSKVERLLASRRRARMMKWVAASLLFAFLGSSVLYGYLINLQFRKTEIQRQLAEANFQRAEANFQSAREVVNQFLTDFAKDDSLKNVGLMPLQRKLLDSAKKYYDLFVAQKSDDPQVLYEQMHALFDIAGLETRFGNHQDVASYYLRAIELGNRLIGDHPDNPTYLDLLAKSYRDLCVFYQMIEFDADTIRELYLKAVAINRVLADQHPENAEYQRNLARILHNLGESLGRRVSVELSQGNDNFSQAERYYRESLAVRERVREKDPPEYLYGSAQTSLAVGALYLERAKILEKDRKNVLIKDRESGGSPDEEKQLSENIRRLDMIREQAEAAKSELDTALALIERLRSEYPTDYGIMKEFLHGLIRLEQGKLNDFRERTESAEVDLTDALRILESIVEKAPEDLAYQGRLDDTARLLYDTYSALGNDAAQAELCVGRIKALEGVMDRFKEVTDYLCFWAAWKHNLADTMIFLGHAEESVELLDRAMEEFRQRMPDLMPTVTVRERNAAKAMKRELDKMRLLRDLTRYGLMAQNEPPEFQKQYDMADVWLKELDETLQKEPGEMQTRLLYGDWCQKAALASVYLEKPERAVTLLEDAVKEIDALPDDRKTAELLDQADHMDAMLQTIRKVLKNE